MVLVKYAIVIAERKIDKNKKKTPIHLLNTKNIEVFNNKEEVIRHLSLLETLNNLKEVKDTNKEVIVKRIFSFNEFGVTIDHNIVFNGRFYLLPVQKESMPNPFEDEWGPIFKG